MQLDADRENTYIQKNFLPPRHPRHKKSRLKNSKTDNELYWKPNYPSSEYDGCYHPMTSDVWYAQNADFLTKHELHNIHDCSFVDYPIYRDLKPPAIASHSNAENGVYLLPLTGTRFQPVDVATEAPRKKGIFKNLKAALFAKKNAKQPKLKPTFNLPVVNLSTEYNSPVYNRALTVNNLRSSYSMDSLNVIENAIVWRELSNQNGLALKGKHVESAYPNHRMRHHSGSDILADVMRNNKVSDHLGHQDHLRLANNEINDHLRHEDLTQRIRTQTETPKTITKNGVPVFIRTQTDLGNISESQGDMFFDEEVIDPQEEDNCVRFHYTKRQDKKIVPRYCKQQLQLQPPDGIINNYNENIGSSSTLPKLKNSLSSSMSSARSSTTSAQMQNERNLLSLSSLNLNSCHSQQDLLDRHFHTLDRNRNSQRRYLQARNYRCGKQHQHTNQCLSGSGVSVESSDSGLGSYSDSYLAKVKRSVHFNGSDEVFEYIPVNSGVCRQQQRTRQGTIAVKNSGRKPKMASYL